MRYRLRIPKRRALVAGSVLALGIFAALVALALSSAQPATPLMAGVAYIHAPQTGRSIPVEHTSAQFSAKPTTASIGKSGSRTAHHGSTKSGDGGCQISVSVTQTSGGGTTAQSSTVTSSASGGPCSTCVVSVQSSQSSGHGSNTNRNSTTQSCGASGSAGGGSVHVSQGKSGKGGGSITVSSGGTIITISPNGQVTIKTK